MNILTVPMPVYRRVLQHLHRHPTQAVRLPVGVSHWGGHVELIAAPQGQELGRCILVAWHDTQPMPALAAHAPACVGVLLQGRGPQTGYARGTIRLPTHPTAPLHQLRLVGPGMPMIPLTSAPAYTAQPQERDAFRVDPLVGWSRSIGPLGGHAVWNRLRALHYAIIGVGRTGTILAAALVRGAARHLTLLDPDEVGPENLGETLGLPVSAVGLSKGEAVAAMLDQGPVQPNITTVHQSITRLGAQWAIQACDVLITCVDADHARLAASIYATLFGKPLLDIATGIHGQGAGQEKGADVRLMLPGRCIWCFGGLRNQAEARRLLASADAEQAFYAIRNWQHERLGSLLSLNLSALGQALELWQRFMAGGLHESLWWHLEVDAAGRQHPTYPTPPAMADCWLCAFAGWGEEGMSRVWDIIRLAGDRS